MVDVTLFVELHGKTKWIQVMRTHRLPAWLPLKVHVETFLCEQCTEVETSTIYPDDCVQECGLSVVRLATDSALDSALVDAIARGWEFCEEGELSGREQYD